jgi:aldose sugar dehydrogenase
MIAPRLRLRFGLLSAVMAASMVAACGGGGGGGATPTGTGTEANVDAAATTASPPSPASPVPVGVTELTTGLASPWSLAFLPDGRMLVTERPGRLRILSPTGQVLGTFSGVPAVVAEGQGGLLDIVLDPAFAANRRIYFSFAERDAANSSLNGTAVARAVLNIDTLALNELTVIYRQRPKVASSAHFGSRLVFDRSGQLFVTMGERLIDEQRVYAQDLSRGNGKVLRITTDGAAAPGNPGWSQPGAQPEFWSLGHRNPQGAALHPDTGELWISDHGPQGGDEINRVLPGRNYGWPLVSRGQEYGTTQAVGFASLPGMEDPLWVWETIDGQPWSGGPKSSIAPAGIAFYTGAAVPQWRGSLFVAALAGQAVWRLTLNGNSVTAQEALLASRRERLRDVRQGPDGALYLLVDDASNGKVLRWGP